MIAEDLKTLRRITDKLVSNGYLVDQTKEWEYAFDAVPDAIFVINIDHRIRFINKKLSSLLNKTKEEVFNQDCYDVIFGDQSLCDFSQCKLEPHEAGKVFLDKLRGWYQITQAPIKSGIDKLLGFICILRDITDVEIKSRELAASEKKYRTIVKNAPVGLYEIDFNTFKISNVNDLMCEYTGYSQEELLTIDVRNILTSSSLKCFINRIRDAIDGKSVPTDVDYEIKKKDGTTKWVQLHTHYKFNDIGLPIGARVVAFDIDEKKRIREEAERKNRLLETIYRSFPGVIGVVHYPDRTITWVNEKMFKLLGYTKEEIVGKNARILYPSEEDYISTGKAKYKLMQESEDDVGMVRTRLKCKNGDIINVLLVSSKIYGEENNVVFNAVNLDLVCENTDLVVNV